MSPENIDKEDPRKGSHDHDTFQCDIDHTASFRYIAPIATIKSGMAKYIVCCTTKYATFMTVPPSLHDLFLIFSLPFSLFSSEIYKSYF